MAEPNGRSSVTEVGASTGALVRVISGPAYKLDHPGVVFGPGYQFDHPEALAVSGGHLFVANSSGRLTELNVATGALVKVMPIMGDLPSAMVASGASLFVADPIANSLTDLTIGARWAFDIPPGGLAVSGNSLFAASANGYDGDTLCEELDSSTGDLVRAFDSPVTAFPLGVVSAVVTGHRLVVLQDMGSGQPAEIEEIDTGAAAFIREFSVRSGVSGMVLSAVASGPDIIVEP
jgi:outer membrane protein assembly factor BamB